MTAARSTPRGVVAVIAAFRPDASLAANVARIVDQVDRVIVVDDGSGQTWSHVFAAVRTSSPVVDVIHRDRNRGIAAALNTGIARARELGAPSVLTLDQDTAVDGRYVEAAVAAAHRLEAARKPFAAIAAGVQSGSAVRPVVHRDRGDVLTPTMEAIQSGLVIPRRTFDAVGVFDEGLFIDCVDTDFVVRAARAGLPTYLARECSIDHGLGRTVETAGLRVTRSGARSFAFHPAWRRYYISRNRAVMLARHGFHAPRWAVLSLLGEAVQFLRSLLFGPDKAQQGAAFLVGVLHAVVGRRGRLRGRPAALLGAPV